MKPNEVTKEQAETMLREWVNSEVGIELRRKYLIARAAKIKVNSPKLSLYTCLIKAKVGLINEA